MTGPNRLRVHVCVCVCVCADVHIHVCFPQWYLSLYFLTYLRFSSTIQTINLPVSGQLGFLSVCEKPVSFSVSVPFASASFIYLFFFCIFTRSLLLWDFLLCVRHPRLLPSARSSFQLVGSSVLLVQVNRCSSAAAAPRTSWGLTESSKALGESLCHLLEALSQRVEFSFLIQGLLPARDFVSVPSTLVAFPRQSTRHSTHSTRVPLGRSLLPGPALSWGSSSPTPCIGARFQQIQPNPPVVLLKSAEEGDFKAPLCYFTTGCSTRLCSALC